MLDAILLPVRVRYPEADPMGYVYHAVCLVYFEMARTELLRQHGISYADLEREGFFLAVAKASLEYLAPLASEVPSSEKGWSLIARGKTTLACLDRERHLQPLPESITKLFKRKK